MSTLQKSILAHRAGEPPPASLGFSAQAPVPALAIRETGGRRWVLPWSHFVSAEHWDDGSGERVVLGFANHEVVLNGVRLGPLMDAVAGFRLESVASIASKYREQVPESEPSIEDVTVRVVSTSTRVEL